MNYCTSQKKKTPKALIPSVVFRNHLQLSTALLKVIFVIGISLLLSGAFNNILAQTPAAAEPQIATSDSITYAFLPALAYNSDLGLIGGGIASRYHYNEGISPFYSYTNVNAIVSTKGLISFQLQFDKPKIFDSQLRLGSDIYVSRFMENQYYGIGTYQTLPDTPEGVPDYYLYKSFSTGFELTLRRPLLYSNNNGQLDVYGEADFAYRTPWGNNDQRFISIDEPEGLDGGRTSELGVGFIWENRDSEFTTTRGSYGKAGILTGQSFLGSDYNYLVFESELRGYVSFHLLRDIVFANRLAFQHTAGDRPYWKMAELGGEKTMRGYPEYRFRDDNAVYLNTELRTWLFSVPELDFKLGGNLFIDIGRTFPNGTSIDAIADDLKYTFGFGGTSSFFTDDFILRADVGFSDEDYGIYFTAGYMF